MDPETKAQIAQLITGYEAAQQQALAAREAALAQANAHAARANANAGAAEALRHLLAQYPDPLPEPDPPPDPSPRTEGP